jgi:monoterpene epsilon-lactone hydrolase
MTDRPGKAEPGSISTEQRKNLEAVLRQSAFPVDSDVSEQRRLLREVTSGQPLPADVTVTAATLGAVPTAEITIDGIEPRHVVLYFHSGVYVLGDALAAYEALLQNGADPADIAFAGESAGGGLAVATLVNARDHGLPLPAAAFLMSPYADLTLAGTTMETKRELDPQLSRELLQPRVTDYTAGQDAALGLISPIFADLTGLPPLDIQSGTHEVTLDVIPLVPRVFQTFYPVLDEAVAALDRAGQFLSAHLSGAERVTA